MKPEHQEITLDAGHRYELLSLDGEFPQVLQFVKRCDPEHPERFPGNTNSYPGTNLQSVIRAMIKRVDYLQGQIPHPINPAVKTHLLYCLWLLEDRAAERHGLRFEYFPKEMADIPMCSHCGHVVCERLGNAIPEHRKPKQP